MCFFVCSTLSNWMLEFDRWAPSVTKISYKVWYQYWGVCHMWFPLQGTPQYRHTLHTAQVGKVQCSHNHVMKDKGQLAKVSLKCLFFKCTYVQVWVISIFLYTDQVEVHDHWRGSQDEAPPLQVDTDTQPTPHSSSPGTADRYTSTGTGVTPL